MVQTLYPKDYPEGIQFVRTHTGTAAIHIGELPGGGYARVDGQPIQSASELTAVIPPGPRLEKALEWWAHHDDPVPENEPPAVMWKRGALVYVENGVELSSHAEIIQAFPEEGPMQRAALEWFGQRQGVRYQARERQDMQTGIIMGQKPEALPPGDPNPGEWHAGRKKPDPKAREGLLPAQR